MTGSGQRAAGSETGAAGSGRGITRPDVDRILRRSQVVVCCGSGGVGKTTIAASLALRAAESGRRVVVLTIDPARRLAQSLGVGELDNTPRQVKGLGPAAPDSPAGEQSRGALFAMMLDMKRTFDDVVLAHADADRAQQILANPFYQALSSSFAGTQEYMAMERLGQLRASGEWDLIVVDTPPTRSALDFLDAPQRLSRFLDGRLLRLITGGSRAGGRNYLRVVTAGAALAANAMSRLLGAQLLRDLSSFVGAMDAMFGGFRERAEATYRLLKEPGTAFVVVASPEPDALREAAFFVDRLQRDEMPLSAVVVNRMHPLWASLSRERSVALAEQLAESGDAPLAEASLRIHAERAAAAARERRLATGFARSHPAVPMLEVPALAEDVHDLDQLRDIGVELAARPAD